MLVDKNKKTLTKAFSNSKTAKYSNAPSKFVKQKMAIVKIFQVNTSLTIKKQSTKFSSANFQKKVKPKLLVISY